MALKPKENSLKHVSLKNNGLALFLGENVGIGGGALRFPFERLRIQGKL